VRQVRFILFPEFQLLGYVLATETLRIANKCAGERLFEWRTLTATNAPVEASNGGLVAPDGAAWTDSAAPDLVVLCAGYRPLDHITQRVRTYLARARRSGTTIGGVDTGTVILAHLGLLDGYRAVLHHEAEMEFRARWPDISVSDQIYCLDRQRLTAAGGTATGDAMLAWIARDCAPDLATATAVGMSHGRIRDAGELQRVLPNADPILGGMDVLMRDTLAAPITLAALARRLGVSLKQLRRRSVLGFGVTPSEYYLNLRLDEASRLLANTSLAVTEIAFATGFGSLSGLSRAFRHRFGTPPSRARRPRAGRQGLSA
jgi:AraC family carnitine catabolism transcriptional activator